MRKLVKTFIFLMIIAGFFCMWTNSIYAAEKKRIAVLNFNARNASKNIVEGIREIFEVSLYKTDTFDIIERTNIDIILKEQNLQKSECSDTGCAVKIGKIISADIVVIGSVVKIEGFTIIVKLIDIKNGYVVIADSEKAKTEDEIQKSINILTERLSKEYAARASGDYNNYKKADNWEDVYSRYYPVVGVTFPGTPAILNVIVGYYFNYFGIHISGCYFNSRTYGVQLNLLLNYYVRRDKLFSISLVSGITQLLLIDYKENASIFEDVTYNWKYAGLACNFNIRGFFVEIGVSAATSGNNTKKIRPMLIGQIGYLHRFR